MEKHLINREKIRIPLCSLPILPLRTESDGTIVGPSWVPSTARTELHPLHVSIYSQAMVQGQTHVSNTKIEMETVNIHRGTN